MIPGQFFFSFSTFSNLWKFRNRFCYQLKEMFWYYLLSVKMLKIFEKFSPHEEEITVSKHYLKTIIVGKTQIITSTCTTPLPPPSLPNHTLCLHKNVHTLVIHGHALFRWALKIWIYFPGTLYSLAQISCSLGKLLLVTSKKDSFDTICVKDITLQRKLETNNEANYLDNHCIKYTNIT